MKERCENSDRAINSFYYFPKTLHRRYSTGIWISLWLGRVCWVQVSNQLLEYAHIVYVRINVWQWYDLKSFIENFFKNLYKSLKLQGKLNFLFRKKRSTWVICAPFSLWRICQILNNKYMLKLAWLHDAFLARKYCLAIFARDCVKQFSIN